MGPILEGGVYFLLFFTPLAFGGVEGWARGVLQIVAGIVIGAWIWGRRDRRFGPALTRTATNALRLPLALFILLVLFQLLPLPPSWIGALSPGAREVYARTLPGYLEWRSPDIAALPSWLLDGTRGRIPEPIVDARGQGLMRPDLEAAAAPALAGAWRSLSIYPFETRQRLAVLLCFMGLFASTAGYFQTSSRLARLAGASALLGAVVSLLGIVQKLTWNGKLLWVKEGDYKEVFGPFVNRNSYAAFAACLLPLAICMALASWERSADDGRRAAALRRAAVWGAAAVLMAAGIFYSLSRGGILSALLAVAVMCLMFARHGRWSAALVVVGVLAIASGGLLWWIGSSTEVMERVGTFEQGTGAPSLADRLVGWRRSLALISDHLLLGTGLGTFRFGFLRYAPPGLGWWTTAHNEYIELICDTGLIGSALVVWGLAAFAAIVTRPRRRQDLQQRYLYVGLVAGLVGLLFNSIAHSNFQSTANGMLVAVLGGALLRLACLSEPALAATAGRAARRPAAAGLALIGLVALNGASGLSRIIEYRHRSAASEAMGAADLDAAYESLRRAADWQPSDAANWVLMGRMVRDAQSAGATLRALQGRTGPATLGAGVAATAGGIYLNPADSWGWFNLATLYESYRTSRLRIERIRAAGERASRGEQTTDRVAGAEWDLEDSLAAAAAMKAIELEPDFFYYHDFLADLYWERGYPDRAAGHLRDSFALTPSLAPHSILERSDLARALAAPVLEGIEEAAARPADRLRAARARAEMLARLDRVEEAKRAYEELRQVNDPLLRSLCDLELGKLAQAEGRYEESIPILDRALALGDETPWGASALYHLGRAHAKMGRNQQAVVFLTRYLERRPGLSVGYLTMAVVMEDLGKLDEAERLYREALDRFPEEPEVHRRLIDWLRKNGAAGEALQRAEALLDLDPADERTRELIKELRGQSTSP